MSQEGSNLVNEGEQLVNTWRRAQERLGRAKAEVNSAECALQNAETELGRWLTPLDGKIGESFSVWHGDSLITAKVLEMATTPHAGGHYAISVRLRGKSLLR